MSMPEQAFSVHSEHDGRVRRIVVVGELDISTVGVLEAAYESARIADPDAIIVVDLTKLSFIDSTGLNQLVRMDVASGGPGGRLRVVNGSPAVERVLELSGIRDYLPIIDRDADPIAPATNRRLQSAGD